MAQRRPKLELSYNVPTDIELLFDSPQTGDGKYGEWRMIGVKVDGEEHSWFIPDKLWDSVDSYGKGDVITVIKEETKNDKGQSYPSYHVQSDQPASVGTVVERNNEDAKWTKIRDDKSRDIHWQVAVKTAVQALGGEEKIANENKYFEAVESFSRSFYDLIHNRHPETLEKAKEQEAEQERKAVEQEAEDRGIEPPPIDDKDLPF